jgi:sigma-B regulation protein RsbU (phosphoserine phosphatase)
VFEQAAVNLKCGDILVAFTDGVSEAMNPADEEWGEDRLIEAVQACDGLNAAEMIARIMDAADTFVAGARQHDDTTLVVMRVLAEADLRGNSKQ